MLTETLFNAVGNWRRCGNCSTIRPSKLSQAIRCSPTSGTTNTTAQESGRVCSLIPGFRAIWGAGGWCIKLQKHNCGHRLSLEASITLSGKSLAVNRDLSQGLRGEQADRSSCSQTGERMEADEEMEGAAKPSFLLAERARSEAG